jgi:hypothetical protein
MCWLRLTYHSGKKEWFGIAHAEAWSIREGFVIVDASDDSARRIWAVPRALIASVFVTDVQPEQEPNPADYDRSTSTPA